MRWKRKKKRAREVIEQATAAPGELRNLPGECPRCLEPMGPGHESYPCVHRAGR